MWSLQSKVLAVTAAGLVAFGIPTYGVYSTRNIMETRIATLEDELKTVRADVASNASNVQEITSDLNSVAEKTDATNTDLAQARKVTENLKKEHTRTAQELSSELASNSKAVSDLRDEATNQLQAVQQDTSSKIGAVNGEVEHVKGDLDATKTDVAAHHAELGMLRDSLGREIARNSSEVAELRRRGERDYFEFDLAKNSKDMARVADIQLQLKKTDPKKQKYDVLVLADDNKIDKKDRTVNEPITFLVGKDKVRYELVVNTVDKDRIRGYVSAPKDKVLSAEGPTLHPQQ
jgi:chromosome segregation ATPase